MWDLIVSVPDHCLSFYFKVRTELPLLDAYTLSSTVCTEQP